MNPFRWLTAERNQRRTSRPGKSKLSFELLEDRVTPSHTVNIVVPATLDVSNVPEGTFVKLDSSVLGAVGTVSFNWHVTGNVTVDGGSTGSSFSFTPIDDGPVQVTLSATDSADPTDTANAAPVNLTVTNVAPQNLAIDGPTIAVRGQTVDFTSNFSDPGTADTFTYAWSVTRNGSPFALPAGTVTNAANFSFTPTDSGAYVVSLTVSDNNGGVSTATKTLTVTAVAIEGDDLFVGGTTGNDRIGFVPNPVRLPGQHGKPEMGVKVVINGVSQGTFLFPGDIIAFAQAGNDNIQTAGSITHNTVLFGGAGNDRLKGGKGFNVLVGGDGNDLIIGGHTNDIMIGGNGLDRLIGGPGDDLMIGDRTTFDNNLDALRNIMDEWSSSSSYDDRVAHLSGDPNGLNNGKYLTIAPLGGNAATVLNDNAIDRMAGSSGMDWFFSVAGNDRINGKHPTEKLNN